MSDDARRGTFTSRGHRLAYTMHGGGGRPLVYLPGLLLPARMNTPLAEHLSRHGHTVILLDPLGQGRSSRPRESREYSMGNFAVDVVGLLDHLGLREAVVGGTSLGANITLEVAARAPERLRGMVLEMPVLDNALVATASAFTPLLVAMTAAEPAMRAVSRLARMLPSPLIPLPLDVLLDALRQDPGPSAALLTGTFFGRTAPPREQRKTFRAPSLVIGHHRDPIHPFSDAGMLARELPHGRLLEASSILEMRFRPGRLHAEIERFLDEVWAPGIRIVRPPGPRARTAPPLRRAHMERPARSRRSLAPPEEQPR